MPETAVPPDAGAARSGDRRRFDVAVVGGGAVGLGTAMALATGYRATVVVVEAERTLAAHQTGHNSGVIHSGLYYKPGSLKATLCTTGREMLVRFCDRRGIAYDRCGKVVVATCEREVPALDELARRGTANGLRDLRRLGIGEIREHEPHVAGIAGLYVGETGIVDYRSVANAYADVVREHGGEVRTVARLVAVKAMKSEFVLETTAGDVECRGVVNCAGLQSDRVARLCGAAPDVRIVPFRGEYYKLGPRASGFVRNLIYPVPDPSFPFLGVHFTRMIGGGVEAGPNAVLALARHGYSWRDVSLRDLGGTLTYGGFWKMARKYWRTGFGEMHRSLSRHAFLGALRRLLPELEPSDLEPGGAGVRAQAMERSGALVDDFRIQAEGRAVHVLNAPSPAATASIAIGEHVAGVASKVLGIERRRAAVGAGPVAETGRTPDER